MHMSPNTVGFVFKHSVIYLKFLKIKSFENFSLYGKQLRKIYVQTLPIYRIHDTFRQTHALTYTHRTYTLTH